MTNQQSEISIAPRVDIFENATIYKMVTDLPGVALDELELRYERNHLELKANTSGKSYYRRFNIPNVKQDEITAELKNGVLDIELPKQESAQSRIVPIVGA